MEDNIHLSVCIYVRLHTGVWYIKPVIFPEESCSAQCTANSCVYEQVDISFCLYTPTPLYETSLKGKTYFYSSFSLLLPVNSTLPSTPSCLRLSKCVCVWVCVRYCVCAIDVPIEADLCMKNSSFYGPPWPLTTAFDNIMGLTPTHTPTHLCPFPTPPVHTCIHPAEWFSPMIKTVLTNWSTQSCRPAVRKS